MQPQGNFPGDIHWRSFPTDSSIYLPVRQLIPLAIKSTLTIIRKILPSFTQRPKTPRRQVHLYPTEFDACPDDTPV